MKKVSEADKAVWAAATANVAPLAEANRIISPQKSEQNQAVTDSRPVFLQESNCDAIDLHNMTLKDANKAVIDWIHTLYVDRARLALVITGRGRGEESISKEFPRWCEVLPLRNWIAAIEERNMGGAWLIRLKKH
jgi:DNA-nicking Smr family endonuclease